MFNPRTLSYSSIIKIALFLLIASSVASATAWAQSGTLRSSYDLSARRASLVSNKAQTATPPTRATASANRVVNGSFEDGLEGWTVVNLDGSDGSWLPQTGTVSPNNDFSVAPPTDGVQAAMTDAAGPGTHILYQDVLIPNDSTLLRFDLFALNQHEAWVVGSTLDFGGEPN